MYANLKVLANERRGKLDENLKLFQYNREVEDLKSWIADRQTIASSQDIGQDYDNIQMIEERYENSHEVNITKRKIFFKKYMLKIKILKY